MKSYTTILVGITILLLGASEKAVAYSVIEFPICTAQGNQQNPDVKGDIVAWRDLRGVDPSIYWYALSNETEHAVGGLPENEARVGDGVVIWWADRFTGNDDIYGYDISTRTAFAISGSENDEFYPAVDKKSVVWQKRNGGIFARRLFLGETFVIYDGGASGAVDISGDIVVWHQYDYDNQHYDIHGYNLEDASTFPICTNPTEQEGAAIDGNIVVWLDDRNGNWDIYGYNLEEQIEFPVVVAGSSQRHLDLCGDIVVWTDDRNGNLDIYGYDLSSDLEFPICTKDGDQQSPRIDGNIIVWQDARGGETDIYGAYLYRHDDCAHSTPIHLDEPYEGTTEDATGLSTSSCGYKDTFDVWHTFEPELTGEHTVSLCGSSFDTTLAIFDECNGAELFCNDDTPAGICSNTVLSQLTVTLQKGSTYYIRVAGHNGQAGDYTLTVTGPICTEPIVGDLNSDCEVDMKDLAMLTANWLKCNLYPQDTYCDPLIDLAELVDPGIHNTDAVWRERDGGYEFSAGKPRAYVSLPYALNGSYDLLTRLTIERSKETVQFLLPVENAYIAFDIKGDCGNSAAETATMALSGLNPDPPAQQSRTIVVGQEYEYLFNIIIDQPYCQIKVFVDKKLLYSWYGVISAINPNISPKYASPSWIELQTAYYTVAYFSELEARECFPVTSIAR